MEDKKQEWTLAEENSQPQQEKQEKPAVDKNALADYIIARMPQEMLAMLEEGKDMDAIVTQWENRMLKKENQALKSRLEKAVEKPLTLAGEGGEGEKDPFAAAFMQAMNQYR